MASPVEQIKSRLNIVDVVSSYIRLQKAGINLKAPCPFHHEKTPSFFVSPSRDTWHCFGCNRGGDMFSFVMEIEGVEFSEALKILASRAGVELTPVSQEYKSERGKLLGLAEEAKKYFINELHKHKKVMDYLKERGLKEATIKEFGIGYAPEGWRNLHSHLKNKKYLDSEMEKAGMVIQSQKSNLKSQNLYDRFRNRIIFPLNNSAGQTVGFSGRIFGKEDESTGGKYINTPQTILYDKSRLLYAFDKAKTEIRKSDGCVLVEGNMDAIMSHQAGVKNTVAVSGTALTSEHLKIIKRLTDNLFMAFDKDEAGFKASKRGIDMALSAGFEIKVIIIPKGKDPADTVREDQKTWIDAIKKAKNIIDFYLESLAEKFKDRELQKKIRELVLPYIILIPDEMEKAQWVKKIAGMLKIKEEPIWEEIKKTNPSLENENFELVSREEPKKTRIDLLRERLTGLILWQKDSEDEELRCAINDCVEKYDFGINADGDDAKRHIFSAELFYSGMPNLHEEFKKLAIELEKEEIRLEQEEIAGKIRELESLENEEELIKYLDKFNQLNKRLKELI